MSQDDMVALGGLLSSAADAYRAAENQRVEEVARLRQELEEARVSQEKLREEMQQEMQQQISALKASFATELKQLRHIGLLEISLRDIAGSWFVTNSNERVTVSEDGTCRFDAGKTQTVALVAGKLLLDGSFILSSKKSTRTMLIWEKPGASKIVWTYEMPGGSRQVTLDLDVTQILEGRENQRYWHYTFSLIGCEVTLVLGRNRCNLDGTYSFGDSDLGVYFGLLKSTVKMAKSPNTVDAINCRVLIEVWDAMKQRWVFLLRTGLTRFEAGRTQIGTHASITLNHFNEIIAKQQQVSKGTFRISITDIGMLELSIEGSVVIKPSLSLEAGLK